MRGLGFRVQGCFGFRAVSGFVLGLRPSEGFRSWGCGFRVWASGIWARLPCALSFGG